MFSVNLTLALLAFVSVRYLIFSTYYRNYFEIESLGGPYVDWWG